MTGRPAADDHGLGGATLWAGTTFTVTPRESRREPPGIRVADAVRILVQLRGGNADAYDIGPADGTLYAFRVDRSGHLLCALDAPGLADAIMADLSGVPLPGAA